MTHFTGLPKSLRIGPHDIDIVLNVKTNTDRWAEWNNHTLKINIYSGAASGSHAVYILLHEIEHAIHDTFGVDYKLHEEESVTIMMSTGWTQVWRDNPMLLKWMAKTLAK